MLCSWISHVTSNTLLMHLDATLLTFNFLINTLLMLWPWLSTMSLWTWSWCILMLCSWISHVTSKTLLMLRSWLSHQHALDATPLAFCNVTLNKVLMHLDAMLLNFSCSFQNPLDATLLAFSSSFQPTRSWCILVLRSWLSHATSDTLLMLHS